MTSPQSSAAPAFRVRLPRHLLEEQIGFVALLWPAFAASVLVVLFGVNYWGEVTASGWDIAVQAVRWFTLFIGVYVGWSALPLYLAHGMTRREFWWQTVMFVPAYAVAVALMVTVTFVAEAGLYAVAGWEQVMQEQHLYDSPWDLHLVFVQAFVTIAVWTAGGVFIAAAWYRSDRLGGAAIVLGIIFAGISGGSLTGDWGPFSALRGDLNGSEVIGGAIGVLIHVALLAALGGLSWGVMRDIAIRPKAA